MRKGKVIGLIVCCAAAAFLYTSGTEQNGELADQCHITQYADDNGMQCSFYLITHENQVILVDGGSTENAGQVRKVINENGGRVDYWILTHPHPDHIEAFNEIWQDPQGIEIGTVYTIDIDGELYKKYAYSWDKYEDYETFCSITQGDDRINYLYTGDELTIADLQVKVLSAYFDGITEYTKDLANDGSLMFTLTHEEQSMLFCADVGYRMSERIMEMYPDDLDNDYIQMGHHGNGGLTEAFYLQTTPEAAFFDAPEWLMHPDDPDSSYTTPDNQELMESMGAKIYYLADAPHTIEIE